MNKIILAGKKKFNIQNFAMKKTNNSNCNYLNCISYLF